MLCPVLELTFVNGWMVLPQEAGDPAESFLRCADRGLNHKSLLKAETRAKKKVVGEN